MDMDVHALRMRPMSAIGQGYAPTQEELQRYVDTGEATQQFRNWMARSWMDVFAAQPSVPASKSTEPK